MSKDIFEHLTQLVTEESNPATSEIDSFSVREILHAINHEDLKVAKEVRAEIPYVECAVNLVVGALKDGARLIYIGAGTSGRLGVLDASECPPTFGTPPEQIIGIIAGGKEALILSQEGAEDNEKQARLDLNELALKPLDVVCGIAASFRTPYVKTALTYAREVGCRTILVTCNPRNKVTLAVDVAICPVVGPEVIMGSTRMKAGTATKLILNMITTAAMIRLGKVYGNAMVDLQMNSNKLRERAKKTLMMTTGIDYHEAGQTLVRAGGHVKTAIVMTLANVDVAEARSRLEKSHGFVRLAIQAD
jgi:N-acetylmuramic acid 6-phosphate etherase